ELETSDLPSTCSRLVLDCSVSVPLSRYSSASYIRSLCLTTTSSALASRLSPSSLRPTFLYISANWPRPLERPTPAPVARNLAPPCPPFQYLGNPFLDPSLLSQRPAPATNPCRQPVRKLLLSRKGNEFLCSLLRCLTLPATEVELGDKKQGKSQGKGVRQLLGQG